MTEQQKAINAGIAAITALLKSGWSPETLTDADDALVLLRAAAGENTAITQRAINLARGCTDYGGGHRGAEREAFQHGILTVVSVLEAAAAGDNSYQLRVVETIGRELPAPPEGI